MSVRLHLRRVRVPLLDVVHVAATGHGLVGLRLDDDEATFREELLRRFPGADIRRGNAVTTDTVREVKRYLEGGRDPEVDVVFPESGFPVRVWRQLTRIPRGQVRSYGRVARAIRRPGAARAVGQACGRNPVPLVVPCHRVIAADGSLGGFSAGLAVKESLLRLEGAWPR